MDALLGVDCAARITAPFVAAVSALLGARPDVWLRPATGPYACSAAEVAAAKECGIRLAFWDGATTAAAVKGSVTDGLQQGNRLASACSALGYRAGCMTGPDLEAVAGWEPDGPWVAGAVLQPAGWGYAPMVYLSPSHAPSVAAVRGANTILRMLGRAPVGVWLASCEAQPNPKAPPAWSAAPQLAGCALWGWQWAENVPVPGQAPIDLDWIAPDAPVWTPA